MRGRNLKLDIVSSGFTVAPKNYGIKGVENIKLLKQRLS